MASIAGAIVNKVQGALSRQSSSSSSSSASSSPDKKEAKERHNKLSQSLQAAVDNSAKSDAAGTAGTNSSMFQVLLTAKWNPRESKRVDTCISS